MHDPTGFDAIRSPIFVEDQSLSHPNNAISLRIHQYCTIFSGGFPVSRRGGSICSESGSILSIPEAEEVPVC